MADDEKQSRLLRESLTPGETVLHQAKFHWFYMAATAVIFAIWAGLGEAIGQLMLFVAQHVFPAGSVLDRGGIGPALARAHNIPAFICVAIGLLSTGYRLLNQLNMEAYITNKRFLFKRGVFTIQIAKMTLKEINYASVTQSWIGNILGYGGLEIYTNTMDDKNIAMPNIAAPNAFVKALDMAKEAAGVPAAKPATATASA
jgi:hypothetical protein